MHYVDEGEGRPIVFLHGNPTWSFLSRRAIDALSDDYRCIAPDFLGFGLSEKPTDWGYTARGHAGVTTAVVEALEVTLATLVVHDWGGPVGWRWALDAPERVSSLVVSNSFVWPPRTGGRSRSATPWAASSGGSRAVGTTPPPGG